MTPLVHGLRFRTTRAIHWRVPAREGFAAAPDWRIPAGTAGTVWAVGKEAGFFFDGLAHPWGGPAPTIRKPGAPLPEWMEITEQERLQS